MGVGWKLAISEWAPRVVWNTSADCKPSSCYRAVGVAGTVPARKGTIFLIQKNPERTFVSNLEPALLILEECNRSPGRFYCVRENILLLVLGGERL